MARLLTIAFLLTAAPALALPTARDLYAGALRLEQAVRPALAAAEATPAVLTHVRAAVEAYGLVLRHYPTSGYSDNALWQAGRLELDAWEKFHEARDRDAAVRLLNRLARVYVNSSLARQVPEQLARLDSVPAQTPPKAPATTTPATATPRPTTAPVATASTTETAARTLTTIKSIRRTVLPDAVRVTIEFDSEVSFHDERIPDPWRVFLDLPGTRAAPALVDRTLRFESDADVVRQIRIGRHPNNTTRVVLEANGVASYSVYPLYDPFRLVIDCVRSNALLARANTKEVKPEIKPEVRPKTAPAPPLYGRTLSVLYLRRAPSLSPSAALLIASARTAAPDAPAVAAAPTRVSPAPSRSPALSPPAAYPSTPPPEPPPAAMADIATNLPPGPVIPPAHNMNGGFSMARQLGLGVSRIVIDPGHGGHDPGAKGKGLTEAELVLDVALRLEKLLQKEPGTEVILTRRTDDFIPLQERTAIANREGADLFLSIHGNASPNPTARGIETYFLNFANNLNAAAVAARENAASGQAMGALPDIVKAIALNNKLDESKDLATQVQRAMIERLRGPNRVVKDLGVKQAPFVVLIGAAMPSVLAEISFLTNTQEARLLKSDAYRQRIAEALFNAIRKYQASLKNVTTVAHQ